MSLFVLFSLGIVLAIARGTHHILWPTLPPRYRMVFWVIVFFLAWGSFLVLCSSMMTFTWTPVFVWGILGIIGWYFPESVRAMGRLINNLFQRAGNIPLPKLILWMAIVLTIIIAVVNQDSIGYLGSIWAAVFAIWLILTKGFSLGSPPAKKKSRRRRH